jgi:predicted secreted hydrolase
VPLGGATRARAPVRLPGDEAPHRSPVEWWYFNGHLRGTGPGGHLRCYGFEYVTFQFLGFGPKPLYVGNFAITDLYKPSFHYAVATASHPVPDEKDGFSLHTGSWAMRGGSGRDTLSANLPGYSLELSLEATEPPVLEGDDGVVSLAGMGSSKYYSWTSLAAQGVVVDHSERVLVTGISWMDHQWGSIDLFGGGGWDWFSVQLTDRHQFMFYFLRAKGGEVAEGFGSEISPSGQDRLISGRLAESALGHWHSPTSGITYGSGWRLRFPGGHFVIRPFLADQELDVRRALGEVYWEGDVSVRGEVGGKAVEGLGYVELNPPRG